MEDRFSFLDCFVWNIFREFQKEEAKMREKSFQKMEVQQNFLIYNFLHGKNHEII